MNQDDFQDSDPSSDLWTSSFEDECFRELDSQSRVEPRLQAAEELAAQHLWLGFQHTSTAIAQLYNCKSSDEDGYVVLVPFNKAAESLTKLYKDSLHNARECLRVGLQSGKICRSRDIAAWARKKRKCIRREELLAFLCGKTLPSHSNHHRNRQGRPVERQIPRYGPHPAESTDTSEYSVRDNGLALQGLNGAMSNISVGYNRHSPTTSCSVGPFSSRPSNVENLMIQDEFNRNPSELRKRNNSSSSMDVSMDSPSRKRGKFM